MKDVIIKVRMRGGVGEWGRKREKEGERANGAGVDPRA